MNPQLTAILAAAGIMLAVAAGIFYQEQKRKKTIRAKIRRMYGSPSDRNYEIGETEKISHYFRRRKHSHFCIDDITWNDLDMERLFMMANHTISSPGEEVLYDMMRAPLFEKKKIAERENLIHFFSENTEVREKIQLSLFKIGKTRLNSLSDTILEINNAPEVSTFIHWIMLLLLGVGLFVVLPLNPLAGFFFLLILIVLNIFIYYAGKDREKIEMYLSCFSHLFRMLHAAEKMTEINCPELDRQMKAIREGRRVFLGIRKKAFFVTGQNSDTGDPVQIVLDYIRMITHADILIYNSLLRQIKGKSETVMELIKNIGELDAAISIASFREILPLWCEPEFTGESTKQIEMKAEDLYHPLIQNPTANSIHAASPILITGSNASGKSTFMKNIALNAILSQTICTCTCAYYQAPFLKVMTSMALRDNLSGGESYFIVEVKSLKRILDESQKKEPLLCVIDEVLRGTNTIERIAASSRILKELNQNWILPFAATHDIELSYILNKIYVNYHFEEEILENDVIFHYLLKTGRASSRNAIRLLNMLGYPKNIVEEAEAAAQSFDQTGAWKAYAKS